MKALLKEPFDLSEGWVAICADGDLAKGQIDTSGGRYQPCKIGDFEPTASSLSLRSKGLYELDQIDSIYCIANGKRYPITYYKLFEYFGKRDNSIFSILIAERNLRIFRDCHTPAGFIILQQNDSARLYAVLWQHGVVRLRFEVAVQLDDDRANDLESNTYQKLFKGVDSVPEDGKTEEVKTTVEVKSELTEVARVLKESARKSNAFARGGLIQMEQVNTVKQESSCILVKRSRFEKDQVFKMGDRLNAKTSSGIRIGLNDKIYLNGVYLGPCQSVSCYRSKHDNSTYPKNITYETLQPGVFKVKPGEKRLFPDPVLVIMGATTTAGDRVNDNGYYIGPDGQHGRFLIHSTAWNDSGYVRDSFSEGRYAMSAGCIIVPRFVMNTLANAIKTTVTCEIVEE